MRPLLLAALCLSAACAGPRASEPEGPPVPVQSRVKSPAPAPFAFEKHPNSWKADSGYTWDMSHPGRVPGSP